MKISTAALHFVAISISFIGFNANAGGASGSREPNTGGAIFIFPKKSLCYAGSPDPNCGNNAQQNKDAEANDSNDDSKCKDSVWDQALETCVSSEYYSKSVVSNCGCPSNTQCKEMLGSADSFDTNLGQVMAMTRVSSQQAYRLVCTSGNTDNTANTETADGGSCYQDYQNAKATCLKESEQAATDCDQDNATMQQATNAIKAVGAGSAASMALACSKVGKISQIANTSLGIWRGYCAASQGTCETSCSRAKSLYLQTGCIPENMKLGMKEEYEEINKKTTICVSYKKSINEAAQHVAAALIQMQSAKKCTDDIASNNDDLDKCKKDPKNPLCSDQQRCSNPEFAASNSVCKCIANPNSPECLATNGNPSRGVAGGGLTIPGADGGDKDAFASIGAGGSGAAADGNANTFGNALRDGSMKGDSANLGGQKGNAGLGGGSGSGGGGAGGGSGAGGAGGAAGEKTKINSGFYGGAPGSGGGYFGKSSSGSGSAGGLRANANVGGVNANKLHGSQFDPRRYLAGMNGKNGEYINGPGIDIFKIIKNRIEVKKPTLLDPDFKK